MEVNSKKNYEYFNSITHGKVQLTEVISLIKNYLEEIPDARYSIVIGSDSEEISENGKKGKSINLITAIVVYRKGFGGKYFWKRKIQDNIYTLRDKIYAETMMSLDFATSFVPLLKKSLNGHCPDYDLEIHVDVGEHGETREMIREIVGMVKGNGFIAKTKPYSYGASYVADKYT